MKELSKKEMRCINGGNLFIRIMTSIIIATLDDPEGYKNAFIDGANNAPLKR